MDVFIQTVSITLIIGYIVFAMWFISRRHSLLSFIGSTVGLVYGGILTILASQILASILCWVVAGVVGLAIIGIICS